MNFTLIRKIDRLILAEFTPFFFMGVVAFTLLMVAVTLFREMLNYMTTYGLSAGQVGMFFMLALPQTVAYTFPMAVLFAGLLAFGRLSDSSQITALRAGGIGFFRIVLPAAIFAWFVVLLTFVLNEKVAPQSTLAARNYVQRAVMANGISLELGDVAYMDHEAGWLFAAATGQGSTFTQVKWWDFSRPEMVVLTTADEGYWQEDGWRFVNAKVYTIQEGNTVRIMTTPELDMQISRTPKEILSTSARSPDEMSLQELQAFLHSPAAKDSTDQYIRRIEGTYWIKIAAPFASLLFILIAAPLGLSPQRSSGAWGIGISMLLVLGYYILMTFAVKIVEQGVVAPIVAAWLPNLLYLFAGLILNGRFYVRSG
jgi:lipopolysaccharide export system permease protein